MRQGHAKTDWAAVVLHEERVTIEMQLLRKVLHDLRQMIESVSEALGIRPGRMPKAGIVRRDQVILSGQLGLEQRLIHPGRRWQPVQEQNRRSIFRPGLSIEDIEITDADSVIGNFAEHVGYVHEEDSSDEDVRGSFHGSKALGESDAIVLGARGLLPAQLGSVCVAGLRRLSRSRALVAGRTLERPSRRLTLRIRPYHGAAA